MNLLASLGTGAVVGIVVGAVVVFLLIVFLIWYVSTHNKFVTMRNNTEEAFNTIDVYLKKRYDLIPNLVSTVKGYAKHEESVFTKVTEARSKVGTATTAAEKIEANAQLSQAMRNFNMVMERYPELKANANFMDLQQQLKKIETELANQRRYYNALVRELNRKREVFPSSIVARRMRIEKATYFELDSAEERKNVKVEF